VAEVFPATVEILLHLGNDRFGFRLFDRSVTGDAAFVSVDVGGGLRILTRYPDDLHRLAGRLHDAADQLQLTHDHGGTICADASHPAGTQTERSVQR
jgi:hypothetical protein